MTDLNYEYEYFYSRKGFNNAATHFDTVADILVDFQQNINLADKLNILLDEKAIVQAQVPALVNALLVDKFGYNVNSYNLTNNFEAPDEAEKNFKDWNAVDLILVYNHPDLGYTVLNPKNKRHWGSVSLFKSNELLTVYAGGYAKTKPDEKVYDLAIKKTLDFFNGKTITGQESLKKGSFKFVSIEQEEKIQKSPKKSTPVKKKAGRSRKSGTEVSGVDKSGSGQVAEKKVQES